MAPPEPTYHFSLLTSRARHVLPPLPSSSLLRINTNAEKRSRLEKAKKKKKMATARFALQSTLRRLKGRPNPPSKRNFSSSAHHDDARKKNNKTLIFSYSRLNPLFQLFIYFRTIWILTHFRSRRFHQEKPNLFIPLFFLWNGRSCWVCDRIDPTKWLGYSPY